MSAHDTTREMSVACSCRFLCNSIMLSQEVVIEACGREPADPRRTADPRMDVSAMHLECLLFRAITLQENQSRFKTNACASRDRGVCHTYCPDPGYAPPKCIACLQMQCLRRNREASLSDVFTATDVEQAKALMHLRHTLVRVSPRESVQHIVRDSFRRPRPTRIASAHVSPQFSSYAAKSMLGCTNNKNSKLCDDSL